MANSRAKSGGWSTNEKLTSAQANTMDIGQAKAWVNDGETLLDVDCEVNMAGNLLTFSEAGDFKLDGTGWPRLGSRTITRYQPAYSIRPDASSVAFAPDVTQDWTINQRLVSCNVAVLEGIRYTLSALPIGMTITAVEALVKHAGASGLPAGANRPNISLGYYDVAALTPDTEVSIGNAYDSSGTLGAYQGFHYLALTGLSEVISATRHYFVNVLSPVGVGTAFSIYDIFLTGTLTTLRTA